MTYGINEGYRFFYAGSLICLIGVIYKGRNFTGKQVTNIYDKEITICLSIPICSEMY